MNSNHIMSSFEKHDHSICSDRYKASIEKYCHQNNLKLTPLRQKVFEILIRACNSKNLLELHTVLFWKYLRYQMLVLTYRGNEAAQEHKDIFEAALERDSEAAAHRLEEHITNGLVHTLDAM